MHGYYLQCSKLSAVIHDDGEQTLQAVWEFIASKVCVQQNYYPGWLLKIQCIVIV